VGERLSARRGWLVVEQRSRDDRPGARGGSVPGIRRPLRCRWAGGASGHGDSAAIGDTFSVSWIAAFW